LPPSYAPTVSLHPLSKIPSLFPTTCPTLAPTLAPTCNPTNSPTYRPRSSPTRRYCIIISFTHISYYFLIAYFLQYLFRPTDSPTLSPSCSPTDAPTFITELPVLVVLNTVQVVPLCLDIQFFFSLYNTYRLLHPLPLCFFPGSLRANC
jgi:hypothetical protein